MITMIRIASFLLVFICGKCHAFTTISPLQIQESFCKHPRANENPTIHTDKVANTQLMASYEALTEKIPSTEVIEAIERSSSDEIIASDIATSAGISLSQARKDLTKLALLTQGDIAVSDDGELIYTFPANINSVLSSTSLKFRALETFNKAKPVLFYLLRVSFGIALISSILTIFSAIFILNQSSDEEDDNRGFRDGGNRQFRGGMGGMSYWWGPSPFDFFYYRPYYGYYGTLPEDRVDPDEMGFLESTFSYIFGDGNPNLYLEQKRLSLAAKMIRENNGAVTAEQLAPFCDDAPDPNMANDSTYVDERFVLPIVTQLDGQPRVTEEGNIVYLFPELQMSTSSTSVSKQDDRSRSLVKRAGLNPNATSGEIKTLLQLNGIDTTGIVEKNELLNILESLLPPMRREGGEIEFLEEEEYKFSLASDGNRLLAGGLGVVNVLGAFYLGGQLSSYAAYGMKLPGFLGAVQNFYPALLSYAVLYNVIPLLRSFWIRRQNSLIQKRNQRRRKWKTAISSAVGKLAGKLLSAEKLGTKMKLLSKKDGIYDTSKPLNELEKKKQMNDLDEFDRLLEG